MKTRIVLPLLLAVVCGGIFLSCFSSPPTGQSVEPINIVGTKWISVLTLQGRHDTMEFIDETTCIYTLSLSGAKNHKYVIKGNKITLDTRDSYFIQGDTLLYKGNPLWYKEKSE